MQVDQSAVVYLAGEAVLPPSLKYRNRHRIGQIQAALPRHHGQLQALRWRKVAAHRFRQAPGFRTKHQPVARLKGRAINLPGALGGEREHALRLGLLRSQKVCPAGVPVQRGVLMVIQPGAAHVLVVHGEAQGLYQVQRAAGVGGQADDVARVGGDFGFD
jgi:hypothetical protein